MAYGQGTYTLSDAVNANAVGERQFGVGNIVKFTTFTSCLGVLWRKGSGQIVGVHFVQSIGQDPVVTPDSVGADARGALTAVLQAHPMVQDTGVILGAVGSWRGEKGDGPNAAFVNWIENTALGGKENVLSFGDGMFGGRADTDAVRVEVLYHNENQWFGEDGEAI